MGLSKSYKTDPGLETDGVVLNYPETKVRVARAGGANKAYGKAFDKVTKPYRRLIASNQMDLQTMLDLTQQVYAQTVVVGWQTEVDGEYVDGIASEDAGEEPGTVLPFNAENVLKVFKHLPDIFSEIQRDASANTLFLADIDQAAAGN